MQVLEHEKHFNQMILSERFHAVNMEISRDHPRASMRALSVATLLMDLGADESDVVLGMVCSTGAWNSIEIKLSEAKAAGRIRVFLGVVEEDPEYEQFVLEDSLLTDKDKLVVDALFVCRLRETIEYYRHMSKRPVGNAAQQIEDMINRYVVAREYLGKTQLSSNVDYYLRELSCLLPFTPVMLIDECDVYRIQGQIPPLIEKIVDSMGFCRYRDRTGFYVSTKKLERNKDLLRLLGLIGAHWPDLQIEKNPCAHSSLSWYLLDEGQLLESQQVSREFCQRLFALAPNPFEFEAFMLQVQNF